jgi:TPR repeat protein
MENVSQRIRDLIGELDTDADRRIKGRVDEGAVAFEKDKILSKEAASYSRVTEALRRVEESVNAVKLARGEKPIRIVDSLSSVDERSRDELERLAERADMAPSALAATLGLRLRQEGRDDEALPWLEAAAKDGDAMAAHTLGLIREERGERERAKELQRVAAEKGDVSAAYNLGRMLDEDGATEEAKQWLHQAEADPLARQLLERIETRDA